jgi:four helix bundle protein
MLGRRFGTHTVRVFSEWSGLVGDTAAPIRSYRDLKVWQRAMELAVECHVLTRGFPRRNSSGLVAQLERTAGSVPANIAEGCGRRSRADYVRHLAIANGSLLEAETHVILAARLGLIKPSDLTRVLGISAEVGRMLAGLIRRLNSGAAPTDTRP